MQNFFKKWSGTLLYSSSKYRNIIINEIFPEIQNNNYKQLRNKPFYLIIDGCRDQRKSNIYNIIGGELDNHVNRK